MTPWPDSPGAQRDRGLDRLRNLTIACFAAAAGLAAFLSVLAASGIPGHSNPGTAPVLGGGQAQGQGQGQTSNQGVSQDPFGGLFGGGGGRPVAVSGGS